MSVYGCHIDAPCCGRGRAGEVNPQTAPAATPSPLGYAVSSSTGTSLQLPGAAAAQPSTPPDNIAENVLVELLLGWAHRPSRYMLQPPPVRLERFLSLFRDGLCGLCTASPRSSGCLARVVTVYVGMCRRLGV